MTPDDIRKIIQSMDRLDELMIAGGSGLSTRQVRDIIDYFENENKQLSEQIIKLTMERNKYKEISEREK